MLQVQLEKLGILSFVRIQEVPTLDSLLKNVWADNADIMSKQYTGTGALKTDYTRTGTTPIIAYGDLRFPQVLIFFPTFR
jgi:hypothetical protein